MYKNEEIYRVQSALVAVSHDNKLYKKCIENSLISRYVISIIRNIKIIILTKNIESQYQTKDIDIQHYYIKKLVNKKVFTIK